MWHKFLAVTLAVACVCVLVQAKTDVFQLTEKRSTRYCGSILADILSLICKGIYNSNYHKKSYADSDSDEDYGYGQHQQYLEETKFPFRTRASATALIPGSFRRYSRGVHDECCEKPCTRAELLSYCGVPTTQ